MHNLTLTNSKSFYYVQYYSFKLANYAFDMTLRFSWIYNEGDMNNGTLLEDAGMGIPNTTMLVNEYFLLRNLTFN